MSHTILQQPDLHRPDVRHPDAVKVTQFSPTHEYVHMLFEGADLVSSFWQPLMKSAGRWQLEVSGLAMKHSQAALRLSHELARCMSPVDVYAANVRYWEAVSSNVRQSQERIAASTVRTDEPQVTVGAPSDVVPLAAGSRTHDIIKLPDEAAASRAAPVRKVA